MALCAVAAVAVALPAACVGRTSSDCRRAPHHRRLRHTPGNILGRKPSSEGISPGIENTAI